MGYDQPDSSGGFAPSNHPEWLGQVLLIWPTSEETVTFQRDNGEPDPTLMVTADIAIITVNDPDTGKPVFLQNTKVGGKAMAGTIRPNKPNRKILGILQSRPAPKGRAYYLEVPDSNSPQWKQMEQLAEAYEQQHPRQQYSAPDDGGGQAPAAWQNAGSATAQTAPAWNSAPAQTTSQPAQAAWGAAPAAPAAQQQSWGAPAAATPAAAPAAPTPPANGVATWAPGLADFLSRSGYDVNQIPDEGAARQLASTLPTLPG